MKRSVWILVAFLLVSGLKTGFSQQRMDEIVLRQSQPMYFDEINWAKGDTTTQFTFLFKISHDYLSFVNRESTGKPPVYHAEMNLSLEVYFNDSTIKRFNQTFISDQSELSVTRNRFEFIQGEITWSDSKRPVRYVVDITDLGNNKSIFKAPRKVQFRKKHNSWFDSAWIGTVKNGVITPANLGKNIPYGSESTVFLAVKDSIQLEKTSIKLLQKPIDDDEFESMPDSFNVTAGKITTLNYSSASAAFLVKGLEIHLPLKDLDAGQYAITLTSAGVTDTVAFLIYWLNMPFSLYDLDLATRTMKYLAPEADYDKLNSGSSRKRIEFFRKYWKNLDPTPKTPYNELMAEYFRRVDFSFATYQSTRDPGWRTDRGKIYILNGEPDTRKRVTPPNQPPQEIWTYSKLNRVFVFADTDGKGDFRLVKSK
ncbi:MAG: GWxTD domain-containing protein [Bacteroidetes bacterium]|nr:GWxTD domain-containing protein [Bacteroidota bacterium]